VLVSVAQLLLRHAMVTLPPMGDAFWAALWHIAPGTGALMLGLTGYCASMGCWYLALHALLSLSYILVWSAAILLPGWGEYFSWRGLAGVGLIILGVLVIFMPQKYRSK